MTQKKLKKLFFYNPEEGLFTRYDSGMKNYVVNSHGYKQIKIDGKSYRAHRLAWLYMTGHMPEKGEEIDHINHVKHDNRWVNIRLVDKLENSKNISKRKSTICQGVGWHKKKSQWRARITVEKKEIFLGYFDSFSDAVDARKLAEVKYGFHENHGK